MSLTPEQVIEMARAAGAVEMRENAFACDAFPWGCEFEIDQLLHFANLAHSAGREAGLDEAKRACQERRDAIETANTYRGRVNQTVSYGLGEIDACIDSISALKGKK